MICVRFGPLPGPDDIADFETDALAGFVLARASAGLADSTIRNEVGQLEQVRIWFGRPLWEMEPPDADAYFGRVLRESAKGTKLARAQALKTYLLLLDGDMAQSEPKKLPYRLLHTAARIVHSGRRILLRINASWPWAATLVQAFHRLQQLPRPAV